MYDTISDFDFVRMREGLMLGLVVVLVLVGKNKVNSYSNQLMLSWVCKFRVEFDNSISL